MPVQFQSPAGRQRLAPRLGRFALTGTRAQGLLRYTRINDQPYPRVTVQIAPGADITADADSYYWVPITADVRENEGINIKQGKSETSGKAEPLSVRLSLNNPIGDYTPDLATGTYYPNIQLNMPLRIYVNPDGLGDQLRGTFYISDYTLNWDESLNMPTVDIQAGGRLQRFGQGRPEARSLFKAWILANSPQPIAYWPMEDAGGSETLQEVMGVSPPMVWDDISTTSEIEPSFGSTGPPGAPVVVQMQDTTEFRADVTAYTTSGEWTVMFVCKIPVVPSPNTVVMIVNTQGTLAEWRIVIYEEVGSDTIRVEGYQASDGTRIIDTSEVLTIGSSLTEPYGRWLLFRLATAQNGANLDWALSIVDMETEDNYSISQTEPSATNGAVTACIISNSWTHANWSYGQLTIYDEAISAPPTNLLKGYAGDQPDNRITNVLDYAGEAPPAFVGSFTNSQELGAWRRVTTLEALQDAADADAGILYDGLTGAITYRSRYSMYNQDAALTLNFAASEVAPRYQPVLNDRRFRNEWTVSRIGSNADGSSATVIDTASAGRGKYPDSKSINIYDDNMLIHHAGWEVNLGTVKGVYYPRLNFQLDRDPELASAWCSMDPGDMIAIMNMTSQFPPGTVRLLMLGYNEYINSFRWKVTANCVPALPWDVYIVGDALQGRTQAGSSTLAAAVTTGATSFSVSSSTANLWTTTATFPADFPISASLGGEDVSITAITGSSSPQTFTVTRAQNSTTAKAHMAGTSIQIKDPSPIAL